jgi:DNA-binding MurR/RpiR family transcriptional regulator
MDAIMPGGEALQPKDFEALRSLVLKKHKELPKRLAQVAQYVVENPDEMAFGTAASVAASACVQPSTIVRLAQALGYQGFSDLQSVFQVRLRERPSNYSERVEHAGRGSRETHGEEFIIADGVLDASARSIQNLRSRLNEQRLQDATEVLAKAETIFVLAQQRSYPVSTYLEYLLTRLRIRSIIVGTRSGIDKELLALATERDAALAVSFTPYSPTTVEWARSLADSGVPVVGITDSAFSPIADLSTVWIEVIEANYEGFRTLAGTTALAVSLAVAVAKRRQKIG